MRVDRIQAARTKCICFYVKLVHNLDKIKSEFYPTNTQAKFEEALSTQKKCKKT